MFRSVRTQSLKTQNNVAQHNPTRFALEVGLFLPDQRDSQESAPGTLNLHLTDPVVRQRWIELRSGPAELIRADEPGAYNARCFHVDLKSTEAAAIVWPQIDTYPDDQIEIIASSHLRQELGLTDGTEVVIQVVPRAEALRRTVQAYLSQRTTR